MYSIAQTAKADKVNVYHYLWYLFEYVSKHFDGKTLDFPYDMLTWPDKYTYEKIQTIRIPKLILKNEYDTRPKTPHKNDNGYLRKLLLIQDSLTA